MIAPDLMVMRHSLAIRDHCVERRALDCEPLGAKLDRLAECVVAWRYAAMLPPKKPTDPGFHRGGVHSRRIQRQPQRQTVAHRNGARIIDKTWPADD